MTIKTSTLAGGGGAGFRLAPDLTWPSISGTQRTVSVTTTPLSYATALSLTGKFAIGLIKFESLINEPMDARLTIDGVVIWDAGWAGGTVRTLLGANDSGEELRQYITCNSSLLLEIRTTTDTVVSLIHDARPIL
jgi:hypothetical protein